MPKRNTPPPEQTNFWSNLSMKLSHERRREISALLLFGLGGLILVSLLFPHAGFALEFFDKVLRGFVGWGAYVLAVACFAAGIALLRHKEDVFGQSSVAWSRIVALEVLFVVLLGLLQLGIANDDRASAQLANAGEAGGYLGYSVATLSARFLGSILATLLLIGIGLAVLRFAFDLSFPAAWAAHMLDKLRPTEDPAVNMPRTTTRATERTNMGRRPAAVPPQQQPMPSAAQDSKISVTPKIGSSQHAPIWGLGRKNTAPSDVPINPLLAVPRAKMNARREHLPSLDLLEISSEAKKKIIEDTLAQFGIPAKVVEVNAGPTVTQFGVEPGVVERRGADGQIVTRKIPVSRILSLSNDLALALAASPIRIEAPVPGRSMVGIEVPNEQISVVSLRSVMESESYKKMSAKAAMPIALGHDVSGGPKVAKLEAMPHLLVAGATGSGKSVCVNSIIACMLFAHSPDELRMVMVDPKRVELVNFNGIPHLVGPVITDVAQVVPALRWAVKLMDERLQVFSKAGARNIEAYNEKMDKTSGDRLAYVLIIIDELADLMLAAPDEIEKLVTRLAQMARATGIHLILATQRPSVDVVTGLIKANFPARISFAVTSSVDSRVVLDTPGAEKLLGKGDMLYMSPDSSKLERLQGCFAADDELARLTKHWRDLQEEFDYVPAAPWEGKNAETVVEDKGDELIDQATDVIRKAGTASISMLQRKLGIGYPRAARLIDQLEQRGIVGPDEGGGKPRAVLISKKK